MALKLADIELVSFKELLMANSIQVDATIQLLVEKDSLRKMSFLQCKSRSNLNIKNMNQSDKNSLTTVDQVVDDIIAKMPLDDRVRIANLDENEVLVLELALGKYIRYRLDQMDVDVNKKLLEDCLEKSRESLDEGDAATVILKELWNRLRETHKLRIVKLSGSQF